MGLDEIFEEYMKESKIFKNKKALTAEFDPENIPHRDEQINQIAKILAPILRSEKPSNLFIYGKTGTGKTLCVTHVLNKMKRYVERSSLKIKIIYINCKLSKVADTEYRLLSKLLEGFGILVPPTGLSTDVLFKKFFEVLRREKSHLLIALDEIDALVEKIGDHVLYSLLRINQEVKGSYITLIGISNNIRFKDNLDPRIISSLSEEEVYFPPYNAKELRDIIIERVKLSFKDNVVDNIVINKCAALAAQEHGDARRALDLMRVAGEIAEREGRAHVTEDMLDKAERKIDFDRIMGATKMLTKQLQITFLSIMEVLKRKNGRAAETGEVYDEYLKLCGKNRMRTLTQRSISDFIGELDLYGLINARVVSKGRYGKTRYIKIDMPASIFRKVHNLLRNEFLV